MFCILHGRYVFVLQLYSPFPAHHPCIFLIGFQSSVCKWILNQGILYCSCYSQCCLTNLHPLKSWSYTLFLNRNFATTTCNLIGFHLAWYRQSRLQMNMVSQDWLARIDFPSCVCTTSNCKNVPTVIGTTSAPCNIASKATKHHKTDEVMMMWALNTSATPFAETVLGYLLT